METVSRVYPRFLKKLAAEVFPLYRQLAEGGYNFDKILWSTISPYKLLKEDGGLKFALSQWATEFHASSEWLLDGALRTLHLWYVAPDARERLRWNTQQSFSNRAGVIGRFEFQCGGWETEIVTWSAYSQSVREEFEQKLLEYEKKSREFAESRGLIRAQRQYSPENLKWFVLYQFAGMSSKRIADRRSSHVVDDSTVLKGIKTAAKLIGWDQIREAQPSRSRKTR